MSTDESQAERSWMHESNQLLRFGRHPELELKLAEYDLESSIAHVKMLGETEIVDRETTKALLDGLAQIKRELSEGKAYLKAEHVDIHSALEERLAELIGADLSLNLRIAKSSNDQIATDVRLWLRDAVLDIFAELLELRLELTKLAERDLEIVMPGYTHMQPAMPILLSHWWLANESRFRRDFSRLTDFFKRFNVLPLGAGALAGTSQPIDRTLVAQYLHFDDVIENSLYAVSDRDYMVEFGSVASLVGLHISQIGADLLLWATQEFRFVRLRKAFVFRSQSMPQKSNPVVLEILRSRPSVIFGRLVELVAALKSVPMGYCHDLQDSLPALLDVVDTLKFSLELTRAVLQSVDVNAERMKEIAVSDLTNAAAAVDYLVNGGMPQDQASKIVEHLVHYCTQRHKSLADLELNEWQQFCPAFDTDIYQHVTMEESVSARSSFGGTSLEQVMLGIVRAREMLELDQSNLPKLVRERIKIRQLQNI